MKKPFLILISLILCVSTILTACQNGSGQEGAASGGLAFTSNGDGTCYVSSIGNCTDAYVTIPEVSPTGDRVTGIIDGAFTNCQTLKGLVIPAGVMVIGNVAFLGCENLATVVCYGNPNIADTAFSGCPNVTVSHVNEGTAVGTDITENTTENELTETTEAEFVMPEKTSEGLEFTSNGDGTCYVSGLGTCTDITVVVPTESPAGDTVTSIGEFSFHHGSWNSDNEHAPNIKEIILPDSVTSIGMFAFDSCKGLLSIRIPDGVTSIGQSAFFGCSSLTDIHIPKDLMRIDNSVFTHCDSLAEITIPDGVRSIGERAFDYCDSLSRVTIPDSVTSIEDFAFAYCKMLTTVIFKGTAAQWNAVSKDKCWDYDSPGLHIEFSDGNSSSGTTWTTCTHCNNGKVTCLFCGGEGMEVGYYQDGKPMHITCRKCGGSREVDCDYCNGNGEVAS